MPLEKELEHWRTLALQSENALRSIAYKLGIEQEDLPGSLPSQIIDAIDVLQSKK